MQLSLDLSFSITWEGQLEIFDLRKQETGNPGLPDHTSKFPTLQISAGVLRQQATSGMGGGPLCWPEISSFAAAVSSLKLMRCWWRTPKHCASIQHVLRDFHYATHEHASSELGGSGLWIHRAWLKRLLLETRKVLDTIYTWYQMCSAGSRGEGEENRTLLSYSTVLT